MSILALFIGYVTMVLGALYLGLLGWSWLLDRITKHLGINRQIFEAARRIRLEKLARESLSSD